MTLRNFRMPLAIMTMLAAAVLVAGCGRDREPAGPGSSSTTNPIGGPQKDGSEALGAPSIDIAAGSGVSHAGASMIGVSSADLAVDVPEGAVVRQVLLYWAGGTQAAAGDGEVSVNGTAVEGTLIGGPTHFFDWEGPWYFSAYRADITRLGLVQAGQSTLTISDFNFEITLEDENDGVSVVVIWDDGRPADISVRDGLDLAFCGFPGLLNSTEPQVFTFQAAPLERTANLVILAASVGENRPNRIVVNAGSGQTIFENPLGGVGDDLWDSVSLPVVVPAGVGSVSVQVVSTTSWSPLGASLGWVCAALAVPRGEAPRYVARGVVFIDTDHDGWQDPGEPGIPNVQVRMFQPLTEGTWFGTSDAEGRYEFLLPAGAYVMSVPGGAPGAAFNPDLAAYLSPTTPTSRNVAVSPETPMQFFGYVPDPARILGGIDEGVIATDGFTRETWQRFLRCSIHDDRDGDGDHDDDGAEPGDQDDYTYEMRTRLPEGTLDTPGTGRLAWSGRGHRDDDHCHCDPDSLPFTPEQVRGFLVTVQGLFLPEPFQFTPGREIQEAYDLLRATFTTDEDRVRQELLVTELNYVVGRGIIEHDAVVESIIGWCESLLAWDGIEPPVSAEKGKLQDLATALIILEAVNTGGGGGGIE